MSDLTVNGHSVLAGEVVLRRCGEWFARLQVDTGERVSNPLVIECASGWRLTGYTSDFATPSQGRLSLEVSGALDITRELAPVAYRPVGGVRVRTILEDWSRDSGVPLSQSIAPELLASFLPAWTRERGSAAKAVRTLARALDCSWRFDGDAGLLLIRDTWPTVDPAGVEIIQRDTMMHTVVVRSDVAPAELVPGVTWLGERVSCVQHHIMPDGSARTVVLFMLPWEAIDRDRIAQSTREPVVSMTDDRAFAVTYLARVVAQSADLSTVDVELEPDVAPEKRMMPGLVRVPLYAGIPGQVIELRLDGALQQFCIVTFLNGDRAKPIVSGWLGSPNNNAGKRAQTTRIRARFIELGETGARKVARDTDPVGPNAAMTTWMTDVSTRLSALTSTSGPVVNPSSLPTITPPSSLGTITDGSPRLKTD